MSETPTPPANGENPASDDPSASSSGENPSPTPIDATAYARLTADQIAALRQLVIEHDELTTEHNGLLVRVAQLEEQAATASEPQAVLTPEQARQMSLLSGRIAKIEAAIRDLTGGGVDAAAAFLVGYDQRPSGERHYRLADGSAFSFDPSTNRFGDG